MQNSFAHEIALKNSTNFQKQTQFPKQSFFLGFSDDRFSSGLHFCSGWLRPIEVGHDFGPHFSLPSPNLPREPSSCSILRKRTTDPEPWNSGVPSKISPFPERRQKIFNFPPPRKENKTIHAKFVHTKITSIFTQPEVGFPLCSGQQGTRNTHDEKNGTNGGGGGSGTRLRGIFCARQFVATNST